MDKAIDSIINNLDSLRTEVLRLKDLKDHTDIDIDSVLLIMNEKLEHFLGSVNKINSIQSFPLSAHINERFYEKKTIYVGDAAHSIHPIAGQGWNLGLRDVKTIIKLLKQSKKQNLQIGNKSFCKIYNDECYFDAYRFFEITDKLDWIFKKDKFHFKVLKDSGFKLINKNRTIKKKIVEFAMGF